MSFVSPFPPVDITDVSLYEFLFGGIDDEALDTVALIDPRSGQSTYRELIAQIDAVAGWLAERAVGVGDVVAVHLPNSPAFAYFFHGALRSGAAATTINVMYTAREIASQLLDSGAKVVVTAAAFADQAVQAAREAGVADDNVVIVEGDSAGSRAHPTAHDVLSRGLPAQEVTFDPARHVAVLPYSSGTTGKPKGVMLTHRNLVANIAQTDPLLGASAKDTIIAVLPFFHIYGMTVLLNASLYRRATLVTMPRFDLPEFLSNIEKHSVTTAYIAPPIAVALAKHPLVSDYNLASLRLIVSGAAPLDAELGRAVEQRLNVQMIQGYGMSELAPVSHMIPRDLGASIGQPQPSLSSIGWAVPNSENKIVDPGTGEEVDVPAEGISEPGELWVKGPNVMLGYLNRPDATADTIDSDGYLHTGDLAQVDSTGAVFIVDRLKELIKYKGYQVPPAELEALLLTNSQIADAAVIGVVDEDGEEIPKAFVVRQPESNISASEVMDFIASKVAPHKKVRAVEFIEAVPKSAAGKILRKDLRQPSGSAT